MLTTSQLMIISNKMKAKISCTGADDEEEKIDIHRVYHRSIEITS